MNRPDSWASVPLGTAGRWLSGGTPSTKNDSYWGGDIPWISSGNLTSFHITDSNRRLTELGVKNGTRTVDKNTIIIVVRGMSLKTEVRLGITKRKVAFGQDCKALVASDEFVPEFLAYALSERRSMLLGLVDEAGHGTGRLNTDQLYAVEVPLPPKGEQAAIAEALGALDDKIAANDRIASAALSLGDAQFARQFGELEGDRRTIGELAEAGVLAFGDGYRTKRGEHGQPGLRILRAGDVSEFTINPSGNDYVSDSYRRQIGSKSSQPFDVILTTKGTVGRTAVVPSDLDQVVYSPQICYFRVVDHTELDWGYLAAWFRSRDLQNQIAPLMFNSDMAPYINLQNVRSLEIIVPSREDQATVGKWQSSLLARFDAVQSENRHLAKTRDELLPLLMSGKIRVQDAERTVEEVI